MTERELTQEALGAAIAAWAETQNRGPVDGRQHLHGRLMMLLDLWSSGAVEETAAHARAADLERSFLALLNASAPSPLEGLLARVERLDPQPVTTVYAVLRTVAAQDGGERPVRQLVAERLRVLAAREALSAREIRDREEREDTLRQAAGLALLAEEVAA